MALSLFNFAYYKIGYMKNSSPHRIKSFEKILADHAEYKEQHKLHRTLSVWDLTALGIAAIIGAGSFSSLGAACFSGGPGVIVLFVICGIACAFTALCYAEFSNRIPIAGSAYTYAYASFGELIAWIIGWALLMEYSIGNIYVAFSWSDYCTSFLGKIGYHIPEWLTCSYMEAHKAISSGSANIESLNAWNQAPMLGGFRFIIDLPALVINILITILVYRGVKESKIFTNLMVVLKLAVVMLVIAVGAYYVMPSNWFPVNDLGEQSFMPNGFKGVMASVSSVFFAYIGFDAVSVMAEEAKNPEKDLPRGMIYSLVICTVIYIALALVLTGVIDYRQFDGVGDPLAKIFEIKNIGWMQLLVSFCAIIAMTSVLLVFQMGQPRIWMSMSRDGLLPEKFQEIHPKYKTPAFSTVITGLVVGVPILFTDKSFVIDFTSIATLFAFVLVCGGILLIPFREKVKGRFHLQYINGKWIFPTMLILIMAAVNGFFPAYFLEMFKSVASYEFASFAQLIFWIIMVVLAYITFKKSYSLIPLLGLVSCLYLLTGMTAMNWVWFFIWFAIGLVVYYFYGYKKSKLNPENQ